MRKIKNQIAKTHVIAVLRDRTPSFNPIIAPKRGNMVTGIENVIV